MADPIVVATRRADALHRFDVEAAKLVDSLGVKAPAPIPHEINRDADLKRVHELERVVDFLTDVNDTLGKPDISPTLVTAKAGKGAPKSSPSAKAVPEPDRAPTVTAPVAKSATGAVQPSPATTAK